MRRIILIFLESLIFQPLAFAEGSAYNYLGAWPKSQNLKWESLDGDINYHNLNSNAFHQFIWDTDLQGFELPSGSEDINSFSTSYGSGIDPGVTNSERSYDPTYPNNYRMTKSRIRLNRYFLDGYTLARISHKLAGDGPQNGVSYCCETI